MMQYRALGKTDLQVSELSLGTVQFGMPYGIPDAHGNLPVLPESRSLEIIRRALIEGINFLDTARTYGESEAIIGKALKHRQETVYVATKIQPLSDLMTDEELVKTIKSSIESSRRALNRETLDLLQLHNATPELLRREAILDTLALARHREWIRYQGVTTYGPEAPEKAIAQGYWDTIQVEFNCFNQENRRLFEEASRRGIGVIIRSAMLKGAMTIAEGELPEPLKQLRQRSADLPAFFDRRHLSIPQIALLFVLSHSQVSTVLTGVLSVDQMLENINVQNEPILPPEYLEAAEQLHISDTSLTDPRKWVFESPVGR